MATFSIITPTICRSTLARTRASIDAQMLPGDEHIIVADGELEAWVHDGPQVRLLSTPFVGGVGNPQRDAAINVARGDYLLFVDDDDVLADGALATIRPIVAQDAGALFIFRSEYNGYAFVPDGTILWRTPRIVDGNVGTGMIVCPRRPDLPSWCKHGMRTYNADMFFALEAAAVVGKVTWRSEILTRTRPPTS